VSETARLEVDAILFDLDGTLVDESVSYREAIRLTAAYILRQTVTSAEVEDIKLMPGFNNDWDATWGLIGHRLHGRVLVPDRADRDSQAFRRMQSVFQTYYLGDRLWREMSEAEPPFSWSQPLILRETPLVDPRTLELLSACRLGIVTSRPRVEALMAVRQHGLDRFFDSEAIVAASDAAFEKPHPAPLHELVGRLGCARPVFVGDTVNDALAAFAAGMPFLQVGEKEFGDPEVDARIHVRVRSVNDIVDVCLIAARGGSF
jgi:HAD superfamily hydrolase (TIGR01548 family)